MIGASSRAIDKPPASGFRGRPRSLYGPHHFCAKGTLCAGPLNLLRSVIVKANVRAALYHRVSTVDQNQHAARHDLRGAARRLGLRVVLDVRETGSGVTSHRPGLVRVLEVARHGGIDAVLVWKLDRFGRSAFDLLGNIRQLESAGVRFVSVTQGIDIRPGGDPMSRLLITMLSAVAEFERDLIVERTRLGLANARRAGKRIGRPRASTPPAGKVRRLKARGATWVQIAERLACTVWAARVAVSATGRAPPTLGRHPSE